MSDQDPNAFADASLGDDGDPFLMDGVAEDGEDDSWLEAAGVSRRRGFTMRHPVLLVGVLIGAVFMAWANWPKASYLLQRGQPAVCGDISDRPEQTVAQRPVLRHDSYCRLTGLVQTRPMATGEAKDTTNPYKKDAGRKFYMKLYGANVFVVVPGDREDLVHYRMKRLQTAGFPIDNETGRLINPDVEPGFGATGQTLRMRYSISADRPIWIFDTMDQPMARWPYMLVVVLMGMTALLAIYGLLMVARRRRRAG